MRERVIAGELAAGQSSPASMSNDKDAEPVTQSDMVSEWRLMVTFVAMFLAVPTYVVASFLGWIDWKVWLPLAIADIFGVWSYGVRIKALGRARSLSNGRGADPTAQSDTVSEVRLMCGFVAMSLALAAYIVASRVGWFDWKLWLPLAIAAVYGAWSYRIFIKELKRSSSLDDQ